VNLVIAMWDGIRIQQWTERRDVSPNFFFLAYNYSTLKPAVRISNEGMSALVRDGKLWAQFQHTVIDAVEGALEATVDDTTEATTEAIANDIKQLSR